MSCRMPDDGSADLDKVPSQPEAEDRKIRGPKVSTFLVVLPGAYRLGRGCANIAYPKDWWTTRAGWSAPST